MKSQPVPHSTTIATSPLPSDDIDLDDVALLAVPSCWFTFHNYFRLCCFDQAYVCMGLVYCLDQWGLHFFSRESDETESMMSEGTNRNGEKTDRIKNLKLKCD